MTAAARRRRGLVSGAILVAREARRAIGARLVLVRFVARRARCEVLGDAMQAAEPGLVAARARGLRRVAVHAVTGDLRDAIGVAAHAIARWLGSVRGVARAALGVAAAARRLRAIGMAGAALGVRLGRRMRCVARRARRIGVMLGLMARRARDR